MRMAQGRMSQDANMSAPQNGPVQGEQHEQEIEEREAFQYWGYLFKQDKTGTDRLKGLLSGLKNIMLEHSEHGDCPDLTPKQLAHFYRELHGNYDNLFLETPSESIAFIYKSLGCLHSLQPQEPREGQAQGQDAKFADPTLPALKTEGWVMWQTIQLLLGPDEHSGFLMEAVQKWDVKDPISGEMFPKILPRRCFPTEPDKHMVQWYEGVSDRLRREAHEEERQREMEAHHADVRRIQDRKRDPDEEGSVDSRVHTLAYFDNPLLRDKHGRPTIVRKNSKRPTLSPRPTMMGKGKEAATTMGHVFRNIGSPHLWDGRSSSKSHSRDRGHRRRSLPENRYYGDEGPTSQPRFSPEDERHPMHHHRQPSIQMERPATSSTNDTWNSEEPEPMHSPRQRLRDDQELRHSRSHEPTPSQKEFGDYFQGFDDPNRRRNSAYDNGTPPPQDVGPGFAPSASPLFASHIARQPIPQAPPFRQQQPPPQPMDQGPPRKSPSMRRAQGRPYSRSPDPSLQPRDGDSRDGRNPHHHRRPSSHSKSRERRRAEDYSPGRPPYNDSPQPPLGGPGLHMQPGFPPLGGRGPPRDPRDIQAPVPSGGYPPPGGLPNRDSRDMGRRNSKGRMSGSDLSAYSAAEDQRPLGQPGQGRKQARFAHGVDGRRYADDQGGRW